MQTRAYRPPWNRSRDTRRAARYQQLAGQHCISKEAVGTLMAHFTDVECGRRFKAKQKQAAAAARAEFEQGISTVALAYLTKYLDKKHAQYNPRYARTFDELSEVQQALCAAQGMRSDLTESTD